MNEPMTEVGREAVRLRGLFGGETEARASAWVVAIEQEARIDCNDPPNLASLTRALHQISHERADLWEPTEMCGCQHRAQVMIEKWVP